jgi:hypothetical protein
MDSNQPKNNMWEEAKAGRIRRNRERYLEEAPGDPRQWWSS